MRIRAAGRTTADDAGGAGDDSAPAAGPTLDASAAAPVGTPTPAAPVQQLPTVAPVAAVAPAAPADPAEPTLAAQLTPPIAALAARGDGEHVVTVRVTPENLGAVTVRAHVVAGSMKVELFAAEPHARDALSAMLPDLRRDLAGTDGTGSATVGLGGGDASARSVARGSGSERGSAGSGRPAGSPSAAPAPSSTARSPWRPAPAAGRLDVLA
jgi:flagellar hook-length control protein FliK